MTTRNSDEQFNDQLSAQTISLQMVSRKTAAKLLDCHPTFIDSLCKRGDLQAIKLGAHCKRITIKSLNQFLSSAEEKATGA